METPKRRITVKSSSQIYYQTVVLCMVIRTREGRQSVFAQANTISYHPLPPRRSVGAPADKSVLNEVMYDIPRQELAAEVALGGQERPQDRPGASTREVRSVHKRGQERPQDRSGASTREVRSLHNKLQ